jgi:hypothetical protein
VIVAAAICPCPPLLAAELAGQAEVLPELRAACSVAVGRLTAAAPDLIVVTGADQRTGSWPPDGRLNLAAFAPALGYPRHGHGDAARPPLPLPLGLGALLLDEAGYRGPRAFHGIDVAAGQEACLRLGAELAGSAPRTALLAMGGGSARRSVAAPGYLDERAGPFDAAVEAAVRDGNLAALAALDPALAAELLADGRPAWQALAGALGQARVRTEVLYCDAPFGVGYLAATVTPR